MILDRLYLAKEALKLRLPGLRARKLIFDHLPKCGGSSLNGYLARNYAPEHRYILNGGRQLTEVEAFREMPLSRRHSYRLMLGHHADQLIPLADPRSLKVTILREPVDRIVSHYYYARKTPEHYLYAQIHDEELSLEAYVSRKLSPELSNWYTAHFSGCSAEEVDAKPEEALQQALNNLHHDYDLVGFLQDYDRFIQQLRKMARLRLPYETQPRRNVNAEKPRLGEVPESTLELIRESNALDIRLYQRMLELHPSEGG